MLSANFRSCTTETKLSELRNSSLQTYIFIFQLLTRSFSHFQMHINNITTNLHWSEINEVCTKSGYR